MFHIETVWIFMDLIYEKEKVLKGKNETTNFGEEVKGQVR